MSLWTRQRDAVAGEAEALWFGASLTQKGIVVGIFAAGVVLGGLLF